MTIDSSVDGTWSALSELEPEAREAEMLRRYSALAALELEPRIEQMRPLAKAEYTLPDAGLKELTLSRMRTLLAMPEDDALKVIQAYDAVMKEMPGGVAMRRVSLVQSLASNFSGEDEERLRKIAPAVFAGAPRRMVPVEESAPLPMSREEAPAKKPFWQFWKK